MLLLKHLEHLRRHILAAKRAVVGDAIFLEIDNVLLGLPKAARMHPLLAGTFALKHLFGRALVLVVVRFPADAIKLIG